MDSILQNLAPFFLSENRAEAIPAAPPSQNPAFDPEELFSADRLFPNCDEWAQILQSHCFCRALTAGMMVQLDPVLRAAIQSSSSPVAKAPAHLVGDWLERLGRMTRGPNGRPTSVDLAQLMKAATQKLYGPRIANKVLCTETYPDQSISIQGRPNLLHEMMEELLRNSLDALSALEKERQIEVELRVSLKAAFITVSDNGEGISRETLLRMFFPFFTTREQTGLGLFWVCQALAHHRGRLKLWSQPGRGTEIYLRLPLDRR